MTMFRDFFRRRRLARHVAEHGWVFDYHGIAVTLPDDTELAVANALIKGKYEAEEAGLIARHMPPDQPVIELGGSLGVVSAFIRSRLDPGVDHVIVEANPNLISPCSLNAGGAEVVAKAISYTGDTARFEINDNPHASSLSLSKTPDARIVEVETTTLAQLWEQIGKAEGYTLVADIEGAEVEMTERDKNALSHADTIIMELHPHLYDGGASATDAIKTTMTDLGFTLVEQATEVYVWSRNEKNRTKA